MSTKSIPTVTRDVLLFCIILVVTAIYPNQTHAQENRVSSIEEAQRTMLKVTVTSTDNAITLDYILGTHNCGIWKRHTNIKISRWNHRFEEEGVVFETNTNSNGSFTDIVGPNRLYYYHVKATYVGIWPCDGGWDLVRTSGATERLREPVNVSATQNGYDDRIVVEWEAGATDVPVADYKFNLFRNGDLIGPELTKNLSYVDTGAEPGVDYKYEVQANYHAHKSIKVEAHGMVHDLNIRTTPSAGGVTIEWDWLADMLRKPDGFLVTRSEGTGSVVPVQSVDFPIKIALDPDPAIPGFKYQYIVQPYNDQQETFRSDSAAGGIPPNGTIEGYVTTAIDPATGIGGPVVDVLVCAERSDDDNIPQGDDTLFCATTNAQGYYKIDSIYYHEGAFFQITPFKENHVYNPEYEERSLDLNTFSIGPLNFIDESSFTVSGRVYQVFAGDTCNLENAEILVDGASHNWLTNSEGLYSLTVDLIRDYTFTPEFHGHGFSPESVEMEVSDNLEGIDFRDTTLFMLSGSVTGPCNTYLGIAELQVIGTGAGGTCFDTLVITDSKGNFQLQLPGRKYTVDVIGLLPENDTIVNYFEPDTVDLTSGPAEKHFVYRTPPIIKLHNLPQEGGGEYPVPIWRQYIVREIGIEVLDVYGDSTCPAKQGHVIIDDRVSDNLQDATRINLDSAGKAYYRIAANTPNIHAIPANHPYQKRLNITAHAGQETSSLEQYILVTGHSPREPEFYNTSPELVHWVIRDPPGDKSYASFMKDSTLSTNITNEVLVTSADGLHTSLQLGVIVSVGEFVSADFGSYYYGHYDRLWIDETKTVEGKQVTLSTTEEFRTNDSDQIVGDEGDVFVGATYTMVYGLSDAIDFDWETNQVTKDTLITWDIDEIASTFMYTESHIRNHIIPELEFLSKYSDSTKAARFRDDIEQWKYELFFNDSLKNVATFKKNIDFSGVLSYELASTIATDSMYTKTVKHAWDNQYSGGFTSVVSGCELNIGYQGSYYKEVVDDTIHEVKSSITTQYHLEDDDPGDEFSVSIKEDAHYGTPVFDVFSGTSSCPWERGTQPREGVALAMDRYEQMVPADQPAHFKLYMVNTSQSDESRDYRLSLVQASNPEGAIVEVSGAVLGDDELKFDNMPPNSNDPQQQTVRVYRAEGSSFVYDDLQLQFFSACDPRITTRVTFDVLFENECSGIRFEKPGHNWILDSDDRDTLVIVLKDYDTSDSKISKLGVEYRKKGDIGWLEVFSADVAFVPEDSIRYYWNVSHLEDGQYDCAPRSTARADSSIPAGSAD